MFSEGGLERLDCQRGGVMFPRWETANRSQQLSFGKWKDLGSFLALNQLS